MKNKGSMTTPDKFTQGSLERFDKRFRDKCGRNSASYLFDTLPGDIGRIKRFLIQELKKAYRRGFRDGISKIRKDIDEMNKLREKLGLNNEKHNHK